MAPWELAQAEGQGLWPQRQHPSPGSLLLRGQGNRPQGPNSKHQHLSKSPSLKPHVSPFPTAWVPQCRA